MKIIPKALYGTLLVALSDNTRVSKPLIEKKILYKLKPGEVFFTDNKTKKRILIKPKNEVVRADTRNSYQKLRDNLEYKVTKLKYLQQRNQEEAGKTIEAIGKLISPSTYVGPLFRNNNKSYMDNVISGEGTGNNITNAAIDILTPISIGGLKNIVTNISKKLIPVIKFVKDVDLDRKTYITGDDAYYLKIRFYDNLNSNDLKPANSKYLLWNFIDSDLATVVPVKGSKLDNYNTYMNSKFNLNSNPYAIATTSDYFDDYVKGVYVSSPTNKSFLNMKYSDKADDTFVHEAISHATDKNVKNIPVKNAPLSLPNFMYKVIAKRNPVISDVYANIANPWLGIKTFIKSGFNYKTPNSNKWYEARATLNELRYELFKKLPDNYILQLDNMSDLDLFKLMGELNAYGYDYNNLYLMLPPRAKKTWGKRVRYALKYLPSAMVFPYLTAYNKSNK